MERYTVEGVVVGCFWVDAVPAVIDWPPFGMVMLTVGCLGAADWVFMPNPPNKLTGTDGEVWIGFSNPISKMLFELVGRDAGITLCWTTSNPPRKSWDYGLDFWGCVLVSLTSSSKEKRSTGWLLADLDAAGWAGVLRIVELELGCLTVVVTDGLVGLIVDVVVFVVFVVAFVLVLVFLTLRFANNPPVVVLVDDWGAL
jgi:hypothetical protein